MKLTDVKCPVCGTLNRNLDLEETGGWMECTSCKAATCSMSDFLSRMDIIPILRVKWMDEKSAAVG